MNFYHKEFAFFMRNSYVIGSKYDNGPDKEFFL